MKMKMLTKREEGKGREACNWWQKKEIGPHNSPAFAFCVHGPETRELPPPHVTNVF